MPVNALTIKRLGGALLHAGLRRVPAPLRSYLFRIGSSAILAALRRTRVKGGVVLLFHVVDGGAVPGPSVAPRISLDQFSEQLGTLRGNLEVVRAADMIDAVKSRAAGDPLPIAITIDDDHPLHVETVAPALRKRDLPATFFLNALSLDRPRELWFHRLQRFFDSEARAGRMDESSARLITRGLESTPLAHRVAICERLPGSEPLPGIHIGLDQRDVKSLARPPLSVGFHTRDHVALTDLPIADIPSVLQAGRSNLESVTGSTITTFAFPYGLYSSDIALLTKRAGYDVAFTVEPVAVTPATNPWAIGRFEPGAVDAGAFLWVIARALLDVAVRARYV